MASDTVIWTFLPGLDGTAQLSDGIKEVLPSETHAEFIELPSSGKQDYDSLTDWLDKKIAHGKKRLLIAESFSGPLVLRWAEQRPHEVVGIVLVTSFCDAPLNPGIALLPLRPLFMVKTPRHTLRHFLIGEDASEAEVSQVSSVVQAIPSATLTKRVRAILELIENDSPVLDQVPMMILQAQSDNLIPWEAQRKLEACYPNARTHWIESPHLMLYRFPEQCIQRIAEFASELGQGQKKDGSISSPPH
ncbi:MAG: lysophospholipase [Verrucomicrobiae bacterium]|nr:lysophospholipase [Verrucomicrobiae bacterium]NNJ42368.1 alpha/beta hydrolase [Akkermansiaceae bacterium]